MPEIRVQRFAELTPGDIACWDAWQRTEPDLDSPCFRPEFCAAANDVVGDVKVLVLREAGRPIAFLPFQSSRWRVAEPVISGMNDFHGLIASAATQIDMPKLLREAGMVAARFHSVPMSQQNLVRSQWKQAVSHYLDLSQGFEEYCHERKAAGSETVEKTLRKARRFTREHNARFELRNRSDLALRTLVAWKNEQHAGLGVLTPIQSPYCEDLLKRFLRISSDRFEAFLSVLWGDDQLAAIAYVLRSGTTAHCWFIGYDEKFSKSSPGLILLLKMAEALAAEGVTCLHLGKGNERFKTSLASGSVTVAEGMIGERSLALVCLRAWQQTKQWVKRTPLNIAVRLLRPLRKWWTYGQRQAIHTVE